MDTELARTFLAVIESGSFSNAAEHLHVTQSTVSARLRTLENFLGTALFVRNKSGTSLTAAGRQFQRHALLLTRTVEQARHDVGVPRGYRASITLGGRFGLWEDLLLRWLGVMRNTLPDVSVRAEIGFESDLMQGLIDGRLDIGVMYTPQSRPGMVVEKLFEETLIFVTSATATTPAPNTDYVYVDWGPEFYARHSTEFAHAEGPALTVNIGWLALQHILSEGGSGYFPRRLVSRYVDAGRLRNPADAPTFALPAYAVYALDHTATPVPAALEAIRELVATSTTVTD